MKFGGLTMGFPGESSNSGIDGQQDSVTNRTETPLTTIVMWSLPQTYALAFLDRPKTVMNL
jgi:hypothetical protein